MEDAEGEESLEKSFEEEEEVEEEEEEEEENNIEHCSTAVRGKCVAWFGQEEMSLIAEGKRRNW